MGIGCVPAVDESTSLSDSRHACIFFTVIFPYYAHKIIDLVFFRHRFLKEGVCSLCGASTMHRTEVSYPTGICILYTRSFRLSLKK